MCPPTHPSEKSQNYLVLAYLSRPYRIGGEVSLRSLHKGWSDLQFHHHIEANGSGNA